MSADEFDITITQGSEVPGRRKNNPTATSAPTVTDDADSYEPVIVAVKGELSPAGNLKDAGGYDYLASVVETVPNAANATAYAGIFRE